MNRLVPSLCALLLAASSSAAAPRAAAPEPAAPFAPAARTIAVSDVGHLPPNLLTGASGDPDRSLAIPQLPAAGGK